jgi:NAD(P)-dependent dehydrogenase (short-subunit alcohol dehydrogenase family)
MPDEIRATAMLEQLKFNGEPVLVTGGGSGIGQACCVALAELGASVVIVGRTEGRLRETEALVRAKGADALVAVADVAAEAQVASLRDAVAGRWGRLRGLVNNAGDNFVKTIDELSTEKWREIVAVDLDSVFFMCRAFIPLLLQAKKPAIVNVASTFGVIGHPRMPVYCAAKGGVVNLGRQLAIDYGAKDLRVNSLCPGPTLSPRVKGYFDSGLVPRAPTEEMVMLKRLAECHEIANVAAFLLSEAASFVHGATIVVDGGQTIH